ncbi:SPW repeat protein [Natrarchaeobius chitinivorans]|uniref:SPW repeat-containing integral membrane domain-containing protein n=1 Tax=Natrarchaeobius chitinivorans TaxID=1679083 RepID=A0A3N6PA46_NATCH|nr:SPW repeat protein [Natrarchaeobius chitinivorans]RQG95919.1 hypothetical protein EA473_06985 [Natrarchaeobius chitinivorans]
MERASSDRSSPMAQRTAGLAAGFGFLILISGVFFTGFGLIIVNNVVVGAVLAASAAYAAAVPSGGRLPGIVPPAVVVLFGLWTIAAPFVLGVEGILIWSNVVLGVLVTILAVASVYGSRRESAATGTGTSSRT